MLCQLADLVRRSHLKAMLCPPKAFYMDDRHLTSAKDPSYRSVCWSNLQRAAMAEASAEALSAETRQLHDSLQIFSCDQNHN